jgi:hypothetical protein
MPLSHHPRRAPGFSMIMAEMGGIAPKLAAIMKSRAGRVAAAG